MPSAERMRVGQYIEADPITYPDLAGQRLLITEVVEPKSARPVMYIVRSDQGLVTLGRHVRHIAETDALPAEAEPGPRPRVVEREKLMPVPGPPVKAAGPRPRAVEVEKKEVVHMNATQNIINLANQLGGKREHYIEAGRRLAADVTAYQEQFRSPSSEPVPLSSRSNENEVRAELERVKRERNCTYAEAGAVILCKAGAAKFEERVTFLMRSGLAADAAIDRATQEDPEGAQHYSELPRV